LLVLLPLIIIPFYAYFFYRPASLHGANGAPLEDSNSGGSCETSRENTEKREEERIRVVDREEENEKSNKCMILEVSWPCTLVKVTFKLIPARGR